MVARSNAGTKISDVPFLTLALLACFAAPCRSAEPDAALRREAAAALRKASEFFRSQVATEGGYLWQYSEDLQTREGEGKASATTVWVQPPGTPSVGMAFLDVYDATGDEYYLDAARQAGYCLARGQLRSGGWDYRIEFDPQRRPYYAYRLDAPPEKDAKQRNVSTLDDDTTQSALRLLIRLDKALEFKDAKIHDAATFGLASLLGAQYPNGAWPQRYTGPPDPAAFPVKKASYPESWSRKYPGKDYASCYTFNDNTIADAIDVLFEASRVYRDDRYHAAARKAGDFILLAQMPEPQPAWAQQYDAEMHPAWARKFEPPAVTGGESQGVMRALMGVFRETGDKKYIEPIPRAIAYLEASKLPDGRLARFYELKTNKPLYFTKDYQLTDSDADMPTHYSFQVGNALDQIRREYERLAKADPAELAKAAKRPPPTLTPALTARVRKVVAALDDRGRWVEDGRLAYQGADDPNRRVIRCETFMANIRLLADYVAATGDSGVRE